MNSEFEITGKNLYYKGNLLLSINNLIKDVLAVDGFIILLLEYNSTDKEANIWCYTYNKEPLWQICEPDKLHDVNYYTSIYLRDNKLCAYNINGIEVTIDERTGEILNKELIK